MKTNKLAAGALALALGLGAVTPAFAADTTKTGNEKKGEVLVTQEYRDAETAFVKAFKALQDAKAKEEAAKAVRDEKAAEYKAARKAIEDFNAYNEGIRAELAQLDEEGKELYKLVLADGGLDLAGGAANWRQTSRDVRNTYPETSTVPSDKQVANFNDLIAKIDEYAEKEAELKGQDEFLALQDAADRALEAKEFAQKKYVDAKNARVEAEGVYGSARAAFLAAGADRIRIGEAEKYGDLKYITVDPADEKAESKEDVLAKAEKAYDDARVTVKAVELIKVTAPKVYENNKAAIDTYLEKANTALNKLGKALGKKVALSDVLFSTAYAAEDADLQEIEDLTKEVEEVDKEGKELLENLNKQEEEKPADKEEKPADKEEDKKDEKSEDKKDEKTEDKKEEKAPAAKKASSNAKTGVAGVTGVAGILAAASVAYAASKKRD
ncbi:hypothetical protein [uncultured Anaerococcus sp.]|uniref:hypothetical protein n=1 Tax=uncultured Anaerococcus sp. TaxID=293428 RepID=UPI00280474CD|nr:hypothetical protein [uncultured Anaerococcus sp.]